MQGKSKHSCKCGNLTMMKLKHYDNIAISANLKSNLKFTEKNRLNKSFTIGPNGITVKNLDVISFEPVCDGCFDVICKKCSDRFRIQIGNNIAIVTKVNDKMRRRKSLAHVRVYQFPIQLRQFMQIDQNHESPMFLSAFDPRSSTDNEMFSLEENFGETIDEIDIDYDLMFSKNESHSCSFCDPPFHKAGLYL